MFLEGAQGVVDHHLGLGPRRQHVGVHAHHDLPEALAAQDVADRLAPGAALDIVLQPFGLGGGELAIGVGEQVDAGGVGRGFQQQACVDHRAVDAGGLQAVAGGGPGLDEGQDHGVGSGAGAAGTAASPKTARGAACGARRPTRGGLPYGLWEIASIRRD